MRIITAREGYVYRRIHDGFEMGEIIYLGIDYSTGEPREDKAEYYEEVKDARVRINALQDEIEQLESTSGEGEELLN